MSGIGMDPLGVREIAALLGVQPETVHTWRRRYAVTHPTPPPDGYAGISPYWYYRQPWLDWAATRPAQREARRRARAIRGRKEVPDYRPKWRTG